MPAFQPVARTAFYCCALRASDAASRHPVCGDGYAARFLDDGIRRDLAPLLAFKGPAASNVARHRIIDDCVRDALAADPARRVLLLGAGFDSRAFRLSGGRWWEFEDPDLLALKETRLPAATSPNPLARIGVRFQTESIADHLAALRGDDPAVVILEGVSMYLPDPSLRELAGAVRSALPRATLLCDLMSPAFARRFGGGIRREISRLGATFAERTTHPQPLIEAAGYTVRRRFSIVDRAREAGTVRIPAWLLRTLLKELRDGYAVWEFAPAG